MKTQLELDGKTKPKTTHGGAPSRGKRKKERPLDRKKALHLTLKSSRAVGRWSLLGFLVQTWIRQLIESKARKFGVVICDFANVGNHLHIKVKFQNRELFQNFLRSITSLIARKVTGARRGNPQGKFWDDLAFTRVLKTWTEELNLRDYFEANRIEALYSKDAREDYLYDCRERRAGRGSFSTA